MHGWRILRVTLYTFHTNDVGDDVPVFHDTEADSRGEP